MFWLLLQTGAITKHAGLDAPRPITERALVIVMQRHYRPRDSVLHTHLQAALHHFLNSRRPLPRMDLPWMRANETVDSRPRVEAPPCMR
jgi:hypothetical protein